MEMDQGPINQSKERTMYISEDERWGKAVFACLDRIVELTKDQNMTKETAEAVRILADTARQLETTG